eukprot:COSAG02_NODE_1785_length_10940_cov_9.153399_11_plen_109_part_00
MASCCEGGAQALADGAARADDKRRLPPVFLSLDRAESSVQLPVGQAREILNPRRSGERAGDSKARKSMAGRVELAPASGEAVRGPEHQCHSLALVVPSAAIAVPVPSC